MHFPIRARTSDSHRGDKLSVAGVSVLEKRHCGGRGMGMRGRCAEGIAAGRRNAARVVSGRILIAKQQLGLENTKTV